MRNTSFDALLCQKASLADLDAESIDIFISTARRAKRLPISEDFSPQDILRHLGLIVGNTPTNAAILLFGRKPELYFQSARLSCRSYRGSRRGGKVGPTTQFQGNLISLSSNAFDQLCSLERDPSKADFGLPDVQFAIFAGLLNALCHRDFAAGGAIDIRIFDDEIEIVNPGVCPIAADPQAFVEPHAADPPNRLIADAFQRIGNTSGMGMGLRNIERWCREADFLSPLLSVKDRRVSLRLRRGPPANESRIDQKTARDDQSGLSGFGTEVQTSAENQPELVEQNQPEIISGWKLSRLALQVLGLLDGGAMSKSEIARALGQAQISGQLNTVTRQLVAANFIVQSMPDKPTSKLQTYCLTERGRVLRRKACR
jgi:predicted HTH transcriptional regulator